MKTPYVWYSLGGAVGVAACAITIIVAGCATATPSNTVGFQVEEAPCDPQAPNDRVLPVAKVIFPVEDPRLGVQPPPKGPVAMLLLVDTLGRVTEVKVEISSGRKILDQEAVRSARRTEFRPATVNCEPVEMWTKMQVDFRSGNFAPGSTT